MTRPPDLDPNHHSFFKYCIDPTEYELVETLAQFKTVLLKQSNDPKARIIYHETSPVDANTKIKSPRYYGAGTEALAEAFFAYFGGARYNLDKYRSLDRIVEDMEDTGFDATALTASRKEYGKQNRRIADTGKPIYIQVKGRLNPLSEHTANDGSGIMNFFGNAQAHARSEGHAYSARYLVFTTGKGLHWTLVKQTLADIEVVGAEDIDRITKHDIPFWNSFRRRFGIAEMAPPIEKDLEYMVMQKALEEGSE